MGNWGDLRLWRVKKGRCFCEPDRLLRALNYADSLELRHELQVAHRHDVSTAGKTIVAASSVIARVLRLRLAGCGWSRSAQIKRGEVHDRHEK